MNFGSLFSGIGGLDLGLERAGMTCKWQVEINEFCTKVLTKHWPDVPKFRDIRECGGNLEPVDLICGGFPCQDVSVAGKRAGIEGKRSGLWSEFARIIRILRPRYVLVENVPGLLSAGFGRVLGDLAEGGYDAEWSCLRAVDHGPPHRRERLFCVAYTATIRPSQGAQGILQRKLSGQLGRISRKGWIFGVDNPAVCRVGNGVSFELDRLKALGNAVVPQVAEYIGRLIMVADAELRGDKP
jgi:DNA (cytosine-5)-methyltransferase 1